MMIIERTAAETTYLKKVEQVSKISTTRVCIRCMNDLQREFFTDKEEKKKKNGFWNNGSGGDNGTTIIERCHNDIPPTNRKNRLVTLDIRIRFKREFC